MLTSSNAFSFRSVILSLGIAAAVGAAAAAPSAPSADLGMVAGSEFSAPVCLVDDTMLHGDPSCACSDDFCGAMAESSPPVCAIEQPTAGAAPGCEIPMTSDAELVRAFMEKLAGLFRAESGGTATAPQGPLWWKVLMMLKEAATRALDVSPAVTR